MPDHTPNHRAPDPTPPSAALSSPSGYALNVLEQAIDRYDEQSTPFLDPPIVLTVRTPGKTQQTQQTLPPGAHHTHDVTVTAGWSGEEASEHFRLITHAGRTLLCGQGGTFDLSERTGPGAHQDAELALMTVQGVQPCYPHQPTLGLLDHLTEQGFNAEISNHHEISAGENVLLLTASHPDGTTLWFSITEHRYDTTARHAGLTLGTYLSGRDEDTMALMALEDHEIHQDALPGVPERLIPRRWPVQAQAIGAVVRHVRAHPGTPLSPGDVPGTVPEDFASSTEGQLPDLAYTRAEAQERRRNFLAWKTRHAANPEVLQDFPPEENLPF